jgi:hypothetical protein
MGEFVKLTPAAEFEKSLQSPSHSEANDTTQQSTNRLGSRVWHGAAASQRIADDRQANRPDQDTRSHEVFLAEQAHRSRE